MAKGREEEPASILTQRQRAHLSDEVEVEGGAKWSMHSRIRDRLRRAILDFSLLYEHYDELNLDSVFEDLESEDLHDLIAGVDNSIALFYRGFFDSHVDVEKAIERACFRAERDRNDRLVGFTLTRTEEASGGDVRKLAEMVDNGEVEALRPGQQELILQGLAASDIDVREAAYEGTHERFGLNEE